MGLPMLFSLIITRRFYISTYREWIVCFKTTESGLLIMICGGSFSRRVWAWEEEAARIHSSGAVEVLVQGRETVVYGFNFFHKVSSFVSVKSWLPARSIVMERLLSRGNGNPSGEIMVSARFCPLQNDCL